MWRCRLPKLRDRDSPAEPGTRKGVAAPPSAKAARGQSWPAGAGKQRHWGPASGVCGSRRFPPVKRLPLNVQAQLHLARLGNTRSQLEVLARVEMVVREDAGAARVTWASQMTSRQAARIRASLWGRMWGQEPSWAGQAHWGQGRGDRAQAACREPPPRMATGDSTGLEVRTAAP